jgi:hypothetical protein
MTSSATHDSTSGATSHRLRSGIGRATRGSIAALLAAIVIGSGGAGTSTENRNRTADNRDHSAESIAGAVELMANPTTIKLRRLHLVRPDLLPYPIQLEVYC